MCHFRSQTNSSVSTFHIISLISNLFLISFSFPLPSISDNTPEAPETEGLSTEPLSHAEVSVVGETLEDMSLSSASSLDRNDTSQEYMDDFDNLGKEAQKNSVKNSVLYVIIRKPTVSCFVISGNGGVGILLLSSKNDEDDSGLDQSCARFEDDKVSVNGVTKTTGLCFLDDGIDWAGMRLSGEFHTIQC